MECPSCNFEMSKLQWGEQFYDEGQYTCPECGNVFDIEDVDQED